MISKQITRNFLSLFLSNVIGQLFILWAFIHIARVFGPEGLGRFSFAQVVALYFLYLADFGLQTLGTRAIAQDKGDIRGHVWNVSIVRVVLAAVCFGLLVIATLSIPKLNDERYLIIIFGLSLLPSAVVLEWVFQGIEEMEYVAVGRILKGMVFAGLVFFFVRTSDDLNYAALFYVAGIVMAAVVLLAVYVRKFGIARGKREPGILRTTLIVAIPLAAGAFISQINYNFGTMALGFFMSDSIVGLFSAAYKIVLFLWAFAVVAASNAVLPLLARSYKQSVSLYSNYLKSLSRVFIFIAIPLGVGGSVLGPRIMAFLFPPEYQQAAIVLQISIWAVVIVIYRVIFENALIVSKSQRNYFVGYVLAGTITILGNILLVPVLGLIAPSLVGIVSEFLLLSYFILSTKFISVPYILKTTVKPLLAASIMGAVLYFLPLGFVAALAVGIVIYFALLLLLRGISVAEITRYVYSLTR